MISRPMKYCVAHAWTSQALETILQKLIPCECHNYIRRHSVLTDIHFQADIRFSLHQCYTHNTPCDPVGKGDGQDLQRVVPTSDPE